MEMSSPPGDGLSALVQIVLINQRSIKKKDKGNITNAKEMYVKNW